MCEMCYTNKPALAKIGLESENLGLQETQAELISVHVLEKNDVHSRSLWLHSHCEP